MKFWGIFRFELAYQLRRAWPWLFFTVELALCFLMTRDGALAEALYTEFFINSPFAIAKTMVVGGLLWLMLAPAVAGEAAARDVATGMYPLVYTTPISKTDYLGGRFLAALVLNLLILLAVPLAILLGIYLPGVPAELIGPFRPAAFVSTFGIILLPNAIAATAIQFSIGARTGRAMAAYAGSLLLVFIGFFVAALLLYKRGLGKILDPIGVRFVLDDLSHEWTTVEKNWRMLELQGTILTNRLLWLTIAILVIAGTWLTFRFAHRTERSWWARFRRRADAHSPTPSRIGIAASAPVTVPAVTRTFGLGIHARKTLAIAWASFRTIAVSIPGLAVLVFIPLLTVLVVLDQMVVARIPMVPTTARVIMELTGSLSDELSRWMIVPLLIVFFAGELVWREREAGVDEITDAMPGSEWPGFLGKFLGLGLVLVLFMSLISASGIVAQSIDGYHRYELGLYAKTLLGLQLTDYLLFALLAMVIHVVVNQKYVAHLLAIMAYVFIAVLAEMLHIEHNLLVYGAAPKWSYTPMRGFSDALGPWLWFKLYWVAWAILLAVLAKLLWVRTKEGGFAVRIRLARQRLTQSTTLIGAVAILLIVSLGGFIFYNTNILNEYLTKAQANERRAEYERRFVQFAGVPQPHITATNVRVEIHPRQHAVDARGSYTLANTAGVPIDSIHVVTASGLVDTRAITFDRPATLAVDDVIHGYRIYALDTPLKPGDSLRLDFEVHVRPRGFRESGAITSVITNGTSFSGRLFPAVGYQRDRELMSAADRRKAGLPARPLIAALDDAEEPGPATRGGGITFHAVVGTDGDQIAVAPGALLKTWTERGRHYSEYATSSPIGSEWAFLSARYAVYEGRWNDVAITIFHHPAHTAHIDRTMRSVRASLDYYSRTFGRYPYSHLTLVETGGNGAGMHAEPSFVTFTQGMNFWMAKNDHRLDFPSATLAHEMGHQWTLPSARVEGAPFLSEGLAWYFALQQVKEMSGVSEQRRLLANMRNSMAPIRRGEPLLRAMDPYMSYRKGPFAMHALSEYVGSAQVNGAVRRLIETHDAPGAPLATTHDLYRELQAVTPDSMKYLLHDLFEVTTNWNLETDRVTAVQTSTGTWQVTLDVRARKVVVDSAGNEKELPMNEWVEIGIFGPGGDAGELSKPLHLQKHRIRAGQQSITITVTGKPDLAGIDPFHILDVEESEDDDNIDAVVIAPTGQQNR